MPREPNIPLFLWIATAVLAHLVGGGGADQASDVIGERLEVRRFAQSVRQHVKLRAQPFEVALTTDPIEEEPAAQSQPLTESAGEEDEEEEAEDLPLPEEHPETKATKEEHQESPEEDLDQELDKPDEPELKDEPEPEKKPEEKKADEEKTPEEFPTLELKNRIAVVQHVEDENQKDNPDAEFIGAHANRVEQQTQARITTTDQNTAKPTPGSSYQGPSGAPGNAHVTDIAHSQDSPGEIDRAPNERAGGQRAEKSSAPMKGGGSPEAREANLQRRDGTPNGEASGRSERGGPAQQGQQAVAAARAVDAAPEMLSSPEGRERVAEAREARRARRERKARKHRLPRRQGRQGPMDFLGLGADGTTRGGINLNLSHTAAAAAVGRDQLQREKVADGERRRSKHRGSWKTLGIERWRAAIENYNSSVKPGNQTALNTARVPFAAYLNRIHNRLHPIFADSFLGSLDSLPREHPMNRADMVTNLEIVLDDEDGQVVKMGVTRSSGSTAFDIAALESVQSASPFGKPPRSIVSPDGNVYLHWEFHRNPYYACSTYFARPYILKVKPKEAPPKIKPPAPPPFGPRERAVPDDRRGHLHLRPAEQLTHLSTQ